ncbi:hypothetical protein EV363DRAFT_1458945 [Boletus edulis]|nr:hypothetical protein EV363DRAFT_1458945 [Boletus edulis]
MTRLSPTIRPHSRSIPPPHKAFLATESWKEALDDAKQVISLDSSSPWGYEVNRATSYKAGKYDDAVHAFEAMLSRMAQYPTRTCSYISPINQMSNNCPADITSLPVNTPYGQA